jgi:hypothetical protein
VCMVSVSCCLCQFSWNTTACLTTCLPPAALYRNRHSTDSSKPVRHINRSHIHRSCVESISNYLAVEIFEMRGTWSTLIRRTAAIRDYSVGRCTLSRSALHPETGVPGTHQLCTSVQRIAVATSPLVRRLSQEASPQTSAQDAQNAAVAAVPLDKEIDGYVAYCVEQSSAIQTEIILFRVDFCPWIAL